MSEAKSLPTSGAGALVLAIETSCDDTSVAVLEHGTTLRSHLIAAQDVHRLYGGVVPELASRAHLELLPTMVERALAEAKVTPEQLTGLAVTHAPGLVGSLVVGVAFAKAWAMALERPLVGVNHIEAHLHSASLEHGDSPWPAVALVVSGGHTELVEMRGFGEYRWLGATLDDAAGEAYDKVAKRLGLGFPGGPILDRLAAGGRADAFDLPRPMLDRPGLDFSFSGLKTAVGNLLRPYGEPPYPEALVRDVAASFQAAVVGALVGKCERALARTGAKALSLGGGVACNKRLRSDLQALCESRGVALRIPSPRLCADNAAMIAWVGARRLERGEKAGDDLDAAASLEASGLPVG
jgi:N6-L-threonylcarbamoyladenine synthase